MFCEFLHTQSHRHTLNRSITIQPKFLTETSRDSSSLILQQVEEIIKKHLLTHTTDAEAKQFSCDQCPFKTKIKSHLKRHHRQHTEEKPYSCPHCDFRCRTLENLRKHILKTEKHVGKFVFECQKCKEDLANGEKQQENKAKEIFKTNSHQKYQQHLKSQHKADVLIT